MTEEAQVLPLRDYQRDGIAKLQAAWDRGVRRPALVLPTGGGKTVMFGHITAEFLDQQPRRRALVLAHRDELVTQAAQKIKSIAPHLPVGIVKAERNDTWARVVVASVQSLRSERRLAALRDVGLIVVDECFPAGTLVDGRPIETIMPGDFVTSYDEVTGNVARQRVVRAMRKRPTAMVRVVLDDGVSFACTPNHPIMTDIGWCTAGQLSRDVHVLSFTHDTTATSDVHRVRQIVRADNEGADRHVPQIGANLLHNDLSRRLGEARSITTHGPDQPSTRVSADDRTQPDASQGDSREDVRNSAADQAQTTSTGRQQRPDATSATHAGAASGMADRSSGHAVRRSTSVPLQSRHRTSDNEGVRGSGWTFTLPVVPPTIGQATGRTAGLRRVVDVQVLEPGRDGTYGGVCPDGLVYNIEVESTHTYLINDGIVVHNCHHATAKTYKAILGHYGAFDDASDVQVVGVTATLARSDRQALGEVWQEAIVVASVIDLVKAGHLLDPKGKRIEVPDLRLGEVRKSRGDYQDGDLGRAMVGSLAPEIVAKAYLEHAPTDHGVAFWPTVEAAQVGAEAMNDHGIRTEVIHGKTPLDQRRDILRRADEGRVQALSNCMVLTEGFDWPRARVAVIARPTQSAPLYQQMVGRVLRPFPGQDQALILDVVGASLMHNLASLIDLSEKDVKIRDGESLAEALEREEAERDDRDEVEPTLYRGDTVAADFDPLGRAAKRVWARTRGGTAFLAVSDRYVFLVPATGPDAAPGTWDVAWAAADRPIGGRYGAFLHRGVELGYAARWAELHVDELATGSREGNARSFTSKRSAWRKSHPSGTQVRLAARFGITVEGDMNAGELSELIDGAKASPTVDTFVTRILGR